MIIESFCGHPIIRIQCANKKIYRNKTFLKSVEMSLFSSATKNRIRGQKGDSQLGEGFTTVGQPYQLITLPGSSDFIEWVSEQFLLCKEILGINNKGKTVYYKRSWANRLLFGCSGLCHNHVKIDNYIKTLTDYKEDNYKPDATAVFYLDMPEGSSNIVFIKNGESDTSLDKYDKEDTYWLQPNEGELVIFSPELWHAVSTHNSKLPRNVFAFDIDYV